MNKISARKSSRSMLTPAPNLTEAGDVLSLALLVASASVLGNSHSFLALCNIFL